MNNYQHLDGMVKAIKHHFPGFSDASVRAPLSDYWKNSLLVVWTVEDVFDALNTVGKAISLESASRVLWEAEREHDADRGITWDVLRGHATGLRLSTLSLTNTQQESGNTYYIGMDQKVHIWEGNENAST